MIESDVTIFFMAIPSLLENFVGHEHLKVVPVFVSQVLTLKVSYSILLCQVVTVHTVSLLHYLKFVTLFNVTTH